MSVRRTRGIAVVLATALASVSALPSRAQEAPPAEAPAPAEASDVPAAGPAVPADAPVDAGVAPKKRRKRAEVADAGPGDTAVVPSRPKEPMKDAPQGAVAPEVQAKATKLAADLRDALLKEPGSARDLEALALSAPPDAVLAAEPALKALLKIARARALLLQNRLDEATTVANEARSLVDAVSGRDQRALVAQLRYRQAEIEEAKSKGGVTSCGALGLRRLSALEGKQERARVEQIAVRYKHAINAGERFWARRAAFRTAVAYDELYRKALRPPTTYRGVALPAPLSLGKVDTGTVLAGVLGGAWPAEISRLYAEVLASIDAREPDPTLLAQVSERAAAFARLERPASEQAENPWLKDELPGLVRHHRQWQKKGADGKWAPFPAEDGLRAAQAGLAKPSDTIERAYALVSLADAGKPADSAVVLAALQHDDPRVRLAGLLTAERKPDAAYLDALVGAYTGSKDKGAPFQTLQGALYGVRERALLALRALANDDRSLSEKLLADERLPPRERVWVVAELGEARLQYALPNLIWDKDPQAGATALYALVVAVGSKASGYMRPSDSGPVGCVSKALQDTATR